MIFAPHLPKLTVPGSEPITARAKGANSYGEGGHVGMETAAADNQRLPAVICVMAGNRTTVALELDGEETLMLQSDAPGVLLGRGGHRQVCIAWMIHV